MFVELFLTIRGLLFGRWVTLNHKYVWTFADNSLSAKSMYREDYSGAYPYRWTILYQQNTVSKKVREEAIRGHADKIIIYGYPLPSEKEPKVSEDESRTLSI